jgi:hypothetical protein
VPEDTRPGYAREGLLTDAISTFSGILIAVLGMLAIYSAFS